MTTKHHALMIRAAEEKIEFFGDGGVTRDAAFAIVRAIAAGEIPGVFMIGSEKEKRERLALIDQATEAWQEENK